MCLEFQKSLGFMANNIISENCKTMWPVELKYVNI